ncbi:uncharacterized protein PRCAT00006158001 [Priceomyces carsonii]|uniref:uncharacterized protein n=1 Tax=Priceomyces carsonii TaxID=28549 RepID=UPI002ED7B67F|nr:unnamed protein product [Priceomyces carsonii]
MTLELSFNTFLHPPETPKTSRNIVNKAGHDRLGVERLGPGITPPFSFGLGFLPSFQFSSPRGVGTFNALSPQRFFQTSSSLSKAVNEGRNVGHEDQSKGSITRQSIGSEPKNNKEDSVSEKVEDSVLSTQQESDRIRLQSLSSEPAQSKRDVSNETTSSKTNSIDIWSSLGQDSSHTFDTIYENEQMSFLTPKKLLLSKRNLEGIPGSKGIPELSEVTLTPQQHGIRALKRARIDSFAPGVTESPNTSIASQIESAIESPVNRKRPTSQSVSEPLGDKVWNRDLDDILIQSYVKYTQFLGDLSHDSSVLKSTSQNKVLSRMLLHKTGILRTAKQISSRLFRLSKLKKVKKMKLNMKMRMEDENMAHPKAGLFDESDIGNASFENILPESNNETADSVLDKELAVLLSSPVLKEESLASSPFDEKQPKQLYKLSPQAYQVSFIDRLDSHLSHQFIQLEKTSSTSLDKVALRIKLNDFVDMRDSKDIANVVTKKKVPVWCVENKLQLANDNLATSNMSFTDTATRMNLSRGSFESFMKINVKIPVSSKKSVLNWHCINKVFRGQKFLFETTNMINGYPSSNGYDLEIPFLKQFLGGYFTYLNNGSVESNLDLSVVQIIFENKHSCDPDFNENDSNIFAYILHGFSIPKDEEKTGSTIEMVDLIDDEDIDDDNATVLAVSSPFSSPFSRNQDTDLKKIRRDSSTPRKNSEGAIPIFNADIVQKFNLGMLRHQMQNNYQNRNSSDSLNLKPIHSLNDVAGRSKRLTVSIAPGPQNNQSPPHISISAPIPQLYEPVKMSISQHVSPVLQTPQGLMSSNATEFTPFQQQVHHAQHQYVYNNGVLPPSMLRLSATGLYSAPATQTQFFPSAPPKSMDIRPLSPSTREEKEYKENKENSNPKEIKFGPILGYDPSKELNHISVAKHNKPSKSGLHSFPLNNQVMYKPKK